MRWHTGYGSTQAQAAPTERRLRISGKREYVSPHASACPEPELIAEQKKKKTGVSSGECSGVVLGLGIRLRLWRGAGARGMRPPWRKPRCKWMVY